jgi:photosystem II stability/assembly factor-like uncharacterized protein
MGIIIALYGLEWQKLPDVPVGRGDDIEIGYTQPPQEKQIIYIADRFSWVYKSENGGNTWDSLIPPPSYPPYSRKPLAVVCNKNNAYSVWIAKSERDDPEYKGVYFSWNGGWDWVPRNEGITNFKILCLTQAPDNPNFLFLGCEYVENTPNVFKTENGGMNWIPLGIIQNAYVYDIETPSYASDIFLAATNKGIYKKIGSGGWVLKYDKSVKDLKIHPLNSSIVYAVVDEDNFYSVIKSEDQGETWNIVFSLPSYHKPTSIEITNSGEIYFSVRNANFEDNTILFKSIDGMNWIPLTSENGLFDKIMNKVKADPRNSNFLISGGSFAIYVSNNNGENWEQKSKGFRKFIPKDFSIVLPEKIHVCFSQFPLIFETKNMGENWKLIFSINGTMIRPLWKPLFAHPLFPSKVFIAGEGGVDVGKVVFTENSGINWKLAEFPFSTCNGQRIISHPLFCNILYMVCRSPQQLRISNDGGNNWIGKIIEFNGYTPQGLSIVVHPQNTNIVYIGCNHNYGVVKTEDMGETWYRTGMIDKTVYSLDINPLNPQIIYAGTNNEIWKTKDGGNTWEHIEPDMIQPPSNPPYPLHAYTLLLDPEEPSIIYSGISPYPYEKSEFYITVDAGRKWFDYTFNLPSSIIKDIQIDKDFPDSIFILCEHQGIYFTKTKWEKDQLTSSSSNSLYFNGGIKLRRARDTLWVVYESGDGIFVTYSGDNGNKFAPKREIYSGKLPAIAINADYNPYIIFVKDDTILYGIGRIISGSWPNEPWILYKTTQTGGGINCPCFEIKNNTGFIAFYTGFWHDIKVGYFNTTIPNPEVYFYPNPATGCDVQWVSLDILPNGNPAIVYQSIDDGSKIIYKYWTGIRWSAGEQVSPPAHYALHPFLRIKPDGNPCVAWVHQDRIYYSERTPTGWTSPIALSSSNYISDYPQIYQKPLIVCWRQTLPNSEGYQIVYRWKMGNEWADVKIIDEGNENRDYPQIVCGKIGFLDYLFCIFQKKIEPIYELPFRKKPLIPTYIQPSLIDGNFQLLDIPSNNSQRISLFDNSLHILYSKNDSVFDAILKGNEILKKFLGYGENPSLFSYKGNLYTIWAYNDTTGLEEIRFSKYDTSWSEIKSSYRALNTNYFGIGAPSFYIENDTGYVAFESTKGTIAHILPAPPFIPIIKGKNLISYKFPLNNPLNYEILYEDFIPEWIEIPPMPIETVRIVPKDTFYKEVVPILISPSIVSDKGISNIIWDGINKFLKIYKIGNDTIIKIIYPEYGNVKEPYAFKENSIVKFLWVEYDKFYMMKQKINFT